MNDSEAVTLEQVDKFLKASKGWKFKGLTRDEKYEWLNSAIRRFDYYSCRKKEKGLLRRYMLAYSDPIRPVFQSKSATIPKQISHPLNRVFWLTSQAAAF